MFRYYSNKVLVLRFPLSFHVFTMLFCVSLCFLGHAETLYQLMADGKVENLDAEIFVENVVC